MTTVAPARTPLPNPKDVRELLTGLLGREVEVTTGDPVIPRPKTPAVVGIYTDNAASMRAIIVVDLPLSAYSGAALGLVPVDTAKAAVEEGTLPEALMENFHEVLNVGAGMFNAEEAPRLALSTVVPAGTMPPVHVGVLARTLGRRMDLSVDVPGYGTGGFSVVLPLW